MRKRSWVLLLFLACYRGDQGVDPSGGVPELRYEPVSIQEVVHSIRFNGGHAGRWRLISGEEVSRWLGGSSSPWITAYWREVLGQPQDSLWVLQFRGTLDDTVTYPPLPLPQTSCERGIEVPLLLSYLPVRQDTWRSPVDFGVDIRIHGPDGWSMWQSAEPLGLVFLDGCVLERTLLWAVASGCWFSIPGEEGDSFQVRVHFSGTSSDSFLIGLHSLVRFWRTEGQPEASLTWRTVPVPRGNDPRSLTLRLDVEARICRENPLPLSVRVLHGESVVRETTASLWILPELGDGVLRDPFEWTWTIGEVVLDAGGTWVMEARSPLDTARWVVDRSPADLRLGDTLETWEFPVDLIPLAWDGTRAWFFEFVESSTGDSVWIGWDRPGEPSRPLLNLSRLVRGAEFGRPTAIADEGGALLVNIRTYPVAKIVMLYPDGRVAGMWDEEAIPAVWNRECPFELSAFYDLPGSGVWGGLVHCGYRQVLFRGFPVYLSVRMVHTGDSTWEVTVEDSLVVPDLFVVSAGQNAIHDPAKGVWILVDVGGEHGVILSREGWWQEMMMPVPWAGAVPRGSGEMEVWFARRIFQQGQRRGTAWVVRVSLGLP